MIPSVLIRPGKLTQQKKKNLFHDVYVSDEDLDTKNNVC